MTLKSNIVLDKILKSIHINTNEEVNFYVQIDISTEDNIDFEYYIGERGSQDNAKFITAYKNLSVVKYFADNIHYKPIEFYFRSVNNEISVGTISLKIVRLIVNANPEHNVHTETVTMNTVSDPRFKRPVVHLTNNAPPPPYQQNVIYHEEAKPAWWKNPINIGIIIVIILIIATFVMRNKKDTSSGVSTGSLFID